MSEAAAAITYSLNSSVNPFDGEILESYSYHSEDEIESLLIKASAAQVKWRFSPISERIDCLNRLADVLDAKQDEYARLMTLEMGKPIVQSRIEINKCAKTARFFAAYGPEALKARTPKFEAASIASPSHVRVEPLGLVLAIMPWNFPFWQVLRAAIPNLLLGNGLILKHASNVWGSALAIEAACLEAGFPAYLFTTLRISAPTALKLLEDSRIAAATLTGSEAAGKAIAEAAGRNLKKVVLELGGSDPFIVLSDIKGEDLAKAAKDAVEARCINNGQSCLAAKRFILEKPIAEEFIKHMTTEFERYANAQGDPLLDSTLLGPLAKSDFVRQANEQLEASIADNSETSLTLFSRDGDDSNEESRFGPLGFVQHAAKGSPARLEEFFFPVATVLIAEDENDVINLANETQFGLGSALYTKDIDRAKRLVPQIAAGSVALNSIMHSAAHLPFGGIKSSGFGRELAEEGLLEFANLKSVINMETW